MIGGRAAKDALFDSLAGVAAALSSGRRAEIIEVLAQGPRTVDQVAQTIDQTLANTSHHLRALAAAGLAESTKQGRNVCYRLASDRVYELWSALLDVAANHVERLDELAEAYLGDRNDLVTIDQDEFERRRQSGDVIVIDVRPELEYAAGHIPGALLVPPDRLLEALEELPGDGEVVAYCRGPLCVFADIAVRALRARGRAAYRLVDGYPEWRLRAAAAAMT